MENWSVIIDILILLSGAFVFGLLFEKFKQNAILGYLVAGIFLGPPVLNLISNENVIKGIAELGVTLLLFTIGLEFSWKRLKTLGTSSLWSGILQLLITGCVITVICLSFGLNVRIAIALGVILTPSSTALVLRILTDRGELESIHGRTSLAILLLQDLALVPFVLLVSELGGELSIIGLLAGIGRSVIVIVLFFTVLHLFNRFVLTRILDVSAGSRNSELLFLLAVLISVGSSWAAHEFGISPGIGAFVAGMLLAESPFAVQIRADVSAFRTLFMTLFFASVGMLADMGWMLTNWLVVLVVLVSLIIGKALIIRIIVGLLSGSRRHALATGISIAQAGEFSFLLAGVAINSGILDNYLYQLVVSVILLSLILTPYMVSSASGIAGWFEKTVAFGKRESGDPDDIPSAANCPECHVLIIGFGPSGRGVLQTLETERIPSTLIELNKNTVAQAKKMGIPVVFGDATREQVLREAGLERAALVVVTLPDPRTSIEVIRQVRSMVPYMPVIARARYHIYASDLMSAGAEAIVDEEYQVGELLGKEVLNFYKGK